MRPARLEHLRAHAAAGTPYDAAIVDLHSPIAGSVQLMRAVKADPAIGGLWVIATSSPAAEASNGARHFAYADRWLARPIRPSQLLLSLKELLAQRHREQQAIQGGDGAALEGPQTRHRPAHPMRVLVVEDNAINQKLALNQLRKLGYAADAIDNGTAALDLMARSAYAAVLMDCQMPRMDGYATTAEIRRREAGRQHTIVIAMTAFAHDGARERCFAAGMDDYISKPVRLEALEAALTRWVPLKGMSNGQNANRQDDVALELREYRSRSDDRTAGLVTLVRERRFSGRAHRYVLRRAGRPRRFDSRGLVARRPGRAGRARPRVQGLVPQPGSDADGLAVRPDRSAGARRDGRRQCRRCSARSNTRPALSARCSTSNTRAHYATAATRARCIQSESTIRGDCVRSFESGSLRSG